ncbi:MAG: hypothetical protein KC431_21765 [Myxococcales bacterium]|nr:hypothetical protein [Myxococcales bacterium]MCA9700167.1 hypothetical protein [Myxococcales bacterium]
MQGVLLLWLAAGGDRALIEARAQALELAPLVAGTSSALSLLVLEAPERELPLEVRFSADAGFELLEDRLDWSAVVDPLALQPRLSVPFRAPEQPGEYRITASVDYSVCSEQWCRRKHGEVAWTVVVQAAATD